jgi:hypothetical protein
MDDWERSRTEVLKIRPKSHQTLVISRRGDGITAHQEGGYLIMNRVLKKWNVEDEVIVQEGRNTIGMLSIPDLHCL